MSSRNSNLKEISHVLLVIACQERSGVKYMENQCLLKAFFKLEESVGVSTAFFFSTLTSGITRRFAHSSPIKSVDTSTWGLSRASAWAFFCGHCQPSVSGSENLNI